MPLVRAACLYPDTASPARPRLSWQSQALSRGIKISIYQDSTEAVWGLAREMAHIQPLPGVGLWWRVQHGGTCQCMLILDRMCDKKKIKKTLSTQLHTLSRFVLVLNQHLHCPECESFFNVMLKKKHPRNNLRLFCEYRQCTCMDKCVWIHPAERCSPLKPGLCRLLQLLSITAAVGSISSDTEGKTGGRNRHHSFTIKPQRLKSSDQISTDLHWWNSVHVRVAATVMEGWKYCTFL